MPPLRKITKKDILLASSEIIKKEGVDSLNARKIAKYLGCSTQPIFTSYNNMEDIKNETLKSIEKFFDKEMMKFKNDKIIYKDFGWNYINFAKNHPEYFMLLFNSKDSTEAKKLMELSGEHEVILETIKEQTTLSIEDAKKFHLRMWLFVNGIASLIASNTCTFTDEEIDNLLRDEYISLMLLEIKKGNINRDLLEKQIKEKRNFDEK